MLNNKDIYMYNLIGTTNRTYMKHVYQRRFSEPNLPNCWNYWIQAAPVAPKRRRKEVGNVAT